MVILKRTNGEIIAQDPDKTIIQLIMENKDNLAYADLSNLDLRGLDLSPDDETDDTDGTDDGNQGREER
ncbi:hypothetical protein [Pseudoscardovia radai]|uniref:hypothetical protein n=1 Tax=Pseudoscardovia radai TaxID=987066 RepID=UPI0039923698